MYVRITDSFVCSNSLRDNPIRDAGALALANALAQNYTLQELK
jgi:hypothetical protein